MAPGCQLKIKTNQCDDLMMFKFELDSQHKNWFVCIVFPKFEVHFCLVLNGAIH